MRSLAGLFHYLGKAFAAFAFRCAVRRMSIIRRRCRLGATSIASFRRCGCMFHPRASRLLAMMFQFSMLILVFLISLGYQPSAAETAYDFHWTVRHKPNPDKPRKKIGNFTISKVWVNNCLLTSESTRYRNPVRSFLIRKTKIEVNLTSVGRTRFTNLNEDENQKLKTTHYADIITLSGKKVSKLSRIEDLHGSKTLSFQDPNIPADLYPLGPNVTISLPYGLSNDVYLELSNHIVQNCQYREVDA